jgi:sarcosine oxidase subunit delta
LAARDTATLEVFGTYAAQSAGPPAALQDKIKAKRPDWKGFS